MQVKIFVVHGTTEGAEQDEINKWLAENEEKIEIIDKTVRSAASLHGHWVTVVFFYNVKQKQKD